MSPPREDRRPPSREAATPSSTPHPVKRVESAARHRSARSGTADRTDPPLVYKWQRAVRRAPRPELPPTAKLVAYALSTYASASGSEIHPGKDLVIATGLGYSTVRRQLELLRDRGWVVRTWRGVPNTAKPADEYQLTFPHDTGGDDPQLAGEDTLMSARCEQDERPLRAKRAPAAGTHQYKTHQYTAHQCAGACECPEMLAAVRDALISAGGKPHRIDDHFCRLTIRRFLGDRAGVREPVAYIRGAISRYQPSEEILPTPGPW